MYSTGLQSLVNSYSNKTIYNSFRFELDAHLSSGSNTPKRHLHCNDEDLKNKCRWL